MVPLSSSIIVTGAFVLTRLTGMIVSMPILNTRLVPTMHKIILAILLTIIITPVVPQLDAQLTLNQILGGVMAEFLLGVLMGGVVTLVFSALDFAGAIISMNIGQAAARAFNPAFMVQSSPAGMLALYMSYGIFLGADLHLVMLKTLANSFQPLPPFEIADPLSGAYLWVDYSSLVFEAGLQLAAPIIVMVLMINTFIAIMAKIAPTMNMFFSVGFIMSMFLGLILFTFMLPSMLYMMHTIIEEVILNLDRITDLAGGQGG